MGNICTVCYPQHSPDKRKTANRPYPEMTTGGTTPSGEGGGQAHLSLARTDTVTGGFAQGSNSSIKSDKRSFITARIPTALNRTNSESRNYSESKVIALFEKYKDEHEDSILSEGIEELCIDLELKPDEFKVLVLAWKFGAEQMCRFTRQEFLLGCRALKADSLRAIQTKLPESVTQVLSDPDTFRDLYRFTYRFGLDCSCGQRILPIDMAVNLWQLVFSLNEPPILKRWLHFLEKHPQVRGVPRDTWNMFLNFISSVGSDLSQYDDTEAWPSLFDDFVEFENDVANQNSSTIPDKNHKETTVEPV